VSVAILPDSVNTPLEDVILLPIGNPTVLPVTTKGPKDVVSILPIFSLEDNPVKLNTPSPAERIWEAPPPPIRKPGTNRTSDTVYLFYLLRR
jgi:hypothetical protein